MPNFYVFFRKFVIGTFLGILSLNVCASLVNRLASEQESLDSPINFYLTDMTANNILVVENSVVSIPVDGQNINLADYSVVSSSDVVTVTFEQQEMILTIGDVQDDTSVSLSLVNTQQTNNSNFDITLSVINEPTFALDNYANLSIDDLLLLGDDAALSRYNGATYTAGLGRYYQQEQALALNAIDEPSPVLGLYGYAAMNKFSGSSYYRSPTVSANPNSSQGLVNIPVTSSQPTPITTIIESGRSLLNDSRQMIAQITMAPQHIINYQPAVAKVIPKRAILLNAPYKEALGVKIKQAVQNRIAFVAANEPEGGSTGDENIIEPEPDSVPSPNQDPEINLPSPQPDGVNTPTTPNNQPQQDDTNDNEQNDSPKPLVEPILQILNEPSSSNERQVLAEPQNNDVVQVPEPAAIYLFLAALAGLLLMNRRSQQPVDKTVRQSNLSSL